MLIFTNFHQFLIKKTTIMNKLFIIFSCIHKNDVFSHRDGEKVSKRCIKTRINYLKFLSDINFLIKKRAYKKFHNHIKTFHNNIKNFLTNIKNFSHKYKESFSEI